MYKETERFLKKQEVRKEEGVYVCVCETVRVRERGELALGNG
jgi:hypothetical protein